MTMRRTLNTLAICALAIAVAGCQGVDDPGSGNGNGTGNGNGNGNGTVAVMPTQLEEIADGFEQPLGIAADGSGRLFVVEQRGTVRVIVDGVLQTEPYLDLSARTTASGEAGLLAIAFHPGFAENGRLFVHFTETVDGVMTGAIVAELTAPPPGATSVDVTDERAVLTIAGAAPRHHGGQLAFGPDGFLYVAIGDRDVPSDAQDLTNLSGSVLRIDVDGNDPYEVPADNPFVGHDTAREEIWTYGLRNPWRISFDSVTGDLWIADVGERAVEEVNRQAAGDADGPNYGWPRMEGNACYPPGSDCDTADPDLTMPLFTYTHASGLGRSVTGGYVYRGTTFTGLAGAYVFADFVSGSVFVAEPDEDDVWTIRTQIKTDMAIATLGRGDDGELYLADYFGGVVYQFAE